MCPIYLRRDAYITLLPTWWVDEGTSGVRDVCHRLSYGRRDLLLHPVEYDQRYIRWRSVPWVSTFLGHHTVSRVSSATSHLN
jgi:hypothetical protein